MKKNYFGLLIFVVLCVTIAAAYATWNYTAAQNVDQITNSVNVQLAEDEVTTVDGTLKVEGSLSAVIDDEDNNHVGELVFSGSGYSVTFTAAEGVDLPDDFQLQATISLSSVTKYDDKEILSVVKETIYGTAGSTSWTISADDIAACLKLDLELPTHDDYEAFEAALEATGTTITITVGVVTDAD